MMKLPTKGETFPTIINDNLLYVDKTELIHKIVTRPGCYFLSRPRRFGKSLLLSTIYELYCGNKDLFKSLWIASKAAEYKFEKFPVISISMTGDSCDKNELNNSITTQLLEIAKDFGLKEIDGAKPADVVTKLIWSLNRESGKPVAFLIDEYDEPIRSHIDNVAQAEINRDVLHTFYSSLKTAMDKNKIKLLFVTGVTKFAKASIFSVFNNLFDISMAPDYHNICGFTMDEFDRYFDSYLPAILEYNKEMKFLPASLKLSAFKNLVLKRYDGYSWDGKQRVINPYTLMNFFERRELQNYWFSSGSPSFLLKYIKRRPLELTDTELFNLNIKQLDAIDVDKLQLSPLLFQTGYLTVAKRASVDTYLLKFPNKEVEDDFNYHLLSYLTRKVGNSQEILKLKEQIANALMNFDANQLADAFTRILSWLTYFEQPEREGFHHAIIFAVLKCLSFSVTSQVVSPEGVIDFLIKAPRNTNFVGEFKYEKLENEPEDDIETRRREKLKKAIALGEEQIAKRRYYKGLFAKGATVKCLAVGIVGRNDVAAKIFDPPEPWFPLP
ncbi:MAG: AAA family ATPase [Deltaproteobacteria bacterium]|jgi:hypothetical protein|nr:AAA family ATPase [Deltaproteobacteria bacterium]